MVKMIKGTSLILTGGKEEAGELQRQFLVHEFAGWESTLPDNARSVRSAPLMFRPAAWSSCLPTSTQGPMPEGNIPQGAELGPATSAWVLALALSTLGLAIVTQDWGLGLKP